MTILKTLKSRQLRARCFTLYGFWYLFALPLAAQQSGPGAKERAVWVGNREVLENRGEQGAPADPQHADYRLFLLQTENFNIYYLAINAEAAAQLLHYVETYYRQLSQQFRLEPKAPIRVFLNPMGNPQGGFASLTPPSIQLVLNSDSSSESLGQNWRERLEANFSYQLARFMLLSYDGSHSRVLTNILRYAVGPDVLVANFLLLPLWLYTGFGYLPYNSPSDGARLRRRALESVYLRGLLLENGRFDYYSSFTGSLQNPAASRANNAISYLMLEHILRHYGEEAAREIVGNVHRRLGLNAALKAVTGKTGQQLFARLRAELSGSGTAPDSSVRLFAGQGSVGLPQTLPPVRSSGETGNAPREFVLSESQLTGKHLRLYQELRPQQGLHRGAPAEPSGSTGALPLSGQRPFAVSSRYLVVNRRALNEVYLPIPVVSIPSSGSDLYTAKLRPAGESGSRLRRLRYRQLTKGRNLFSPVFSADGRYLVAVERSRRGHYRLVEVNQSSGALRVLLENPDYNFFAPSFSHSGARLLFEVHGGGEVDIALLDLRKREAAERLFRSAAWELNPVFGRDDRSVLFAAALPEDSIGPYAEMALLSFEPETGQFHLVARDPAGILAARENPDGSLYYQSYRGLGEGAPHGDRWGSYSLHHLSAQDRQNRALNYPLLPGEDEAALRSLSDPQPGPHLSSESSVAGEERRNARRRRDPLSLNLEQQIGLRAGLPEYRNRQVPGLLPIISSWLPFLAPQKVFGRDDLALGFNIGGGSITNAPFLFQLHYLTQARQLSGTLLAALALGPIQLHYRLQQRLFESRSMYRRPGPSLLGGAPSFTQSTSQELTSSLPLFGASGMRQRLISRLRLSATQRLRVVDSQPFSFFDSFQWRGAEHYGIAQLGFQGEWSARWGAIQTPWAIARNFDAPRPGLDFFARVGYWSPPLAAPYTPDSVRGRTGSWHYGGGVSWNLALAAPAILGLSLELMGNSAGSAAEYLLPLPSFQGSGPRLDGVPSDWALAWQLRYRIPLLPRHIKIGGLGLQSAALSLGLQGRSYFSTEEQYYGYNAQRLTSVIGISWRVRVGSFLVPDLAIGLSYTFFDQTEAGSSGWQPPGPTPGGDNSFAFLLMLGTAPPNSSFDHQRGF